jgi:Transposase DNA-binding
MNIQELLNPRSWAERTFGGVQLHDLRRTRRAVQAARKLAENPLGSLPAHMQTWKETKALYRRLPEPDVTKPMPPQWCSWCKIRPLSICRIVDIHQWRGTNWQRTRTGLFRTNRAGRAPSDTRSPGVHGPGTRMSRIPAPKARAAVSTAQAGRARN